MLGLVIFFAILLLVGHEKLGLKGTGLCLLIMAGLILGGSQYHLPRYVAVPLMTLMDIVLLLVVAGRDFRIW